MAKFKKGDWVEYVTNDKFFKHTHYNIGDIVVIDEDNSSIPFAIRDSDGRKSAIHDVRCEITDKAIAAKIAHLLKHGE